MNKKQKSFDLDRKFVAYALAGSALLATPALATAQNTVSLTGPTSLDFSFDNTIADFTLHVDTVPIGPNEGAPEVYVTGPLTTSFLGTVVTNGPTTYNYPTAFPSVAAVNPSAGTIPSGNLLKVGKLQPLKGNWPNGTGDRWLGVEYQRSGLGYLGWVDIAAAVSSDGVDPVTATATILDGSGSELITPEPSSLALLALGAAGLAMVRKRRHAAH